MLILALVAVFAVTMVLGVPVAFCLGLGGLAFIWLSGVVPIAVLPTLMFSGMDSFPLLAIPFFVIAGSAVMGPIIPPSVAMLVFAYVYGGGISVGKLFLMGIVPGVLIGLAMMAFVAIQARRRSFPVSGERFSVGRVLRALRRATLGLVVPVIIIGGILGGVFTPTEAGAVAAAYGVLVGLFVLRTLKLSDLRKSLLVGAKTSAVI